MARRPVSIERGRAAAAGHRQGWTRSLRVGAAPGCLAQRARRASNELWRLASRAIVAQRWPVPGFAYGGLAASSPWRGQYAGDFSNRLARWRRSNRFIVDSARVTQGSEFKAP